MFGGRIFSFFFRNFGVNFGIFYYCGLVCIGKGFVMDIRKYLIECVIEFSFVFLYIGYVLDFCLVVRLILICFYYYFEFFF